MAHSIAVGELPVAGEESPRESAVLPQRHKSSIRVRLAALFTLCAVLGGIIYMAHAAYQAARDSLVAPLILSPDSDVVLSNKLKMNELQVERTRASAEIEGCEADLQAAQSAVVRLKELYRTTTSSRAWIANVTTHQATAAAVELRTLADQKRVLDSMVEKQTQLVEKARTDMEAGIISRTDYAREAQTLDQMNLAIFENQRATIQGDSTMYEKLLARHALTRTNGAPATPEIVVRDEQVAHIELELLRLESEKRVKEAHKRALSERIKNIDEIAEDLRNRPIFRATEQSLDVAFVPYTQLDGIERGAQVYSCLWGLLFCKYVGTVAEIVPGEVTLPDPWGDQARGQYAVLDLQDRNSAKSKTLRVRRGGDGSRRQATARSSKRQANPAPEGEQPPTAPQQAASQSASSRLTAPLSQLQRSAK